MVPPTFTVGVIDRVGPAYRLIARLVVYPALASPFRNPIVTAHIVGDGKLVWMPVFAEYLDVTFVAHRYSFLCLASQRRWCRNTYIQDIEK
jgi:hypothetical protein